MAGCSRCPGLEDAPADHHDTAPVDDHDAAHLDAAHLDAAHLDATADTAPAAAHPAASPDDGAHADTALSADAAPEVHDPARVDRADAAVGISALGTPVLLITAAREGP